FLQIQYRLRLHVITRRSFVLSRCRVCCSLGVTRNAHEPRCQKQDRWKQTPSFHLPSPLRCVFLHIPTFANPRPDPLPSAADIRRGGNTLDGGWSHSLLLRVQKCMLPGRTRFVFRWEVFG